MQGVLEHVRAGEEAGCTVSLVPSTPAPQGRGIRAESEASLSRIGGSLTDAFLKPLFQVRRA